MTIKVGDRLPEGTLMRMGDAGPEAVPTGPLFAGARVALFGLPGAYTGTCTTAHVPSFIHAKDALAARGVDAVICLAGNDPFVMKAWGDSTGGTAAGLTFLADPSGDFIEALGVMFDAPQAGFHRRARRFSALVEDGTVTLWNEEPGPGDFGATSGEALLSAMK